MSSSIFLKSKEQRMWKEKFDHIIASHVHFYSLTKLSNFKAHFKSFTVIQFYFSPLMGHHACHSVDIYKSTQNWAASTNWSRWAYLWYIILMLWKGKNQVNQVPWWGTVKVLHLSSWWVCTNKIFALLIMFRIENIPGDCQG